MSVLSHSLFHLTLTVTLHFRDEVSAGPRTRDVRWPPTPRWLEKEPKGQLPGQRWSQDTVQEPEGGEITKKLVTSEAFAEKS